MVRIETPLDGLYRDISHSALTLVSRPKQKVKKYLWVLKSDKEVFVSNNYYTDKYDVKAHCAWEILQRIDSEFIEVES